MLGQLEIPENLKVFLKPILSKFHSYFDTVHILYFDNFFAIKTVGSQETPRDGLLVKIASLFLKHTVMHPPSSNILPEFELRCLPQYFFANNVHQVFRTDESVCTNLMSFDVFKVYYVDFVQILPFITFDLLTEIISMLVVFHNIYKKQ